MPEAYLDYAHIHCQADTRDYKIVEKAFRGFFNLDFPKTWFSKVSHFQRLAAVENGGTSLYRAQFVEKLRFPYSC